MSDARLANAEKQRLAANQEALFQIGQAEIQGERRVGATIAAGGASGLRGASKEAVAERVQADIDIVLTQLETRRAEANRSALETIRIQKMADDENIRQLLRGAELAEEEAADLLDYTFLDTLTDFFNVTGSGAQGATSGFIFGAGVTGNTGILSGILGG